LQLLHWVLSGARKLRSRTVELFRTQARRQSVLPFLEANSSSDGERANAGRIVESLGELFLSALTLLITTCIVGSVVAALRAVSVVEGLL
jgi:hypothetical protein